MTIKRLSAAEARALLPALTDLLIDSVDHGSSVGFLRPLAPAEAQNYWHSVIEALETGPRLLLVAEAAGQLLGTVQLDPATKPNAPHRAEVCKLLVHSAHRRQGVARQLLQAAEAAARALGRTTLVLDTRLGDASEQLYQGQGYTRVGAIPEYVCNEAGERQATVVYYKLLEATS
ncbi:GNAT family N-acetyltransferase [Hymenobacter coalescens]